MHERLFDTKESFRHNYILFSKQPRNKHLTKMSTSCQVTIRWFEKGIFADNKCFFLFCSIKRCSFLNRVYARACVRAWVRTLWVCVWGGCAGACVSARTRVCVCVRVCVCARAPVRLNLRLCVRKSLQRHGQLYHYDPTIQKQSTHNGYRLTVLLRESNAQFSQNRARLSSILLHWWDRIGLLGQYVFRINNDNNNFYVPTLGKP